MRNNLIKTSAVICSFVALVLLNIAGCSKASDPSPGKSNNGGQETTDTTPTITSLSVTSGTYNTTVVISGTNFSIVLADNKVYFNGKTATVTAATSTQLTVTVPQDAGTGVVTLSVKGGTTIIGPSFTYNQSQPIVTITSIDITSGTAGTVVRIFGSGFSTIATDNKLLFNGKVATLTAATATVLIATVPEGAGTGAITLSVSNGPTVTGPTFTYLSVAPLKITSTDVSMGLANATVNIIGTGFSTTLTDNKVFFNGKAAVVAAATATKLTVTVPQGAGCGAITATVNGVTVTGPNFDYYLSSNITTLAGTIPGFANGQGSSAFFSVIGCLAVDALGNIYAADSNNNAIRKITASGNVTTLIGTGVPSTYVPGYLGYLTVDSQGNAYYSVSTGQLFKLTPAGAASSFSFGGQRGLTCDKNDNIYTTNENSNSIMRITPNGVSTTFVSGSKAGFTNPGNIVAAASGNLYFTVSDPTYPILKVSPSGAVTTFAINQHIRSIAVDKDENLYVVTENNDAVEFIDHATGTVSVVAGDPTRSTGYTSIDGDQFTARFVGLISIVLDATGNIYVADGSSIRKIALK